MLVRRGTKAGRGGAARARSPFALSRLSIWLAALALFGQLLALPYHHPQGRPDPAEAIASLKAIFGDAAVLCVTVDDSGTLGAPKPQHNHGDGDCPLCQFGTQTVLFDAPSPALPERIEVAATLLIPPGTIARQTAKPKGVPQPRAPPLEA